MAYEEHLDRWRAVDPESEDGQAFHAAMRAMLERIYQGADDDLPLPEIDFILADDPAPYMMVDDALLPDASYEGMNRSSIIISKGLIAATKDEDTLAAMLTYQLLKNELLPERTAHTHHQRYSPLAYTMDAMDYMRDAHYNEQGMMRALELLNEFNNAQPLQVVETVLGSDMSDRARDFTTRMGIAKRTRTQGWQETYDSSATMRDFAGEGNYSDFQIDVASARRTSALEQWLNAHGYHGASLREQTQIFQEALETLPSLSEIPYMGFWHDASSYAYHLDVLLSQAGEHAASNQLRIAFREATQDAGVTDYVYRSEDELIASKVIDMSLHAHPLSFHDDFGFIVPARMQFDRLIEATRDPLKAAMRNRLSIEQAQEDPIEHVLQWDASEDVPSVLREFSEWLEKPANQYNVNARMQWERTIADEIRAVAEDDPQLAGRMAHYALTSCGIVQPDSVRDVLTHWKEGVALALGTEAHPVGDKDELRAQMESIAEDILRHVSRPLLAPHMIAMLATLTEAQPEHAYMLEKKLQHHAQGERENNVHLRGVSEWLGEMLVTNPKASVQMLGLLIHPTPGTVLLDDVKNRLHDCFMADFEARAERLQNLQETVDIVDHMINLAVLFAGDDAMSAYREMVAPLRQTIAIMKELSEDYHKANTMEWGDIKEYITSYTGKEIDFDALESLVNVGNAIFWDTVPEVRGLVTTALLFADGRTPDAMMPTIDADDEPSLSIRDFIKARIIPASLDEQTRMQVEIFMDHYVHNTNAYDEMAILGYALALAKPMQATTHEGRSEEHQQGEMLTQILSSFGPLGVKFAQAIEGMPHVSDELRAGMSSSKERSVDMPRWEYFHKIENRVTPEVWDDISHFGPVLAAGSNQFTGIVTYQGEASALTCLHDAVRERAKFEAEMLQGALGAVHQKYDQMGNDTTALRLAEGLLERSYDVMKTEHNYSIGKWQVQKAQKMYNDLKVTIGDMPVHFKVVDWKTHGDDFKIESIAEGVSFKKLLNDESLEHDDIKKLAKSIITVENLWLSTGQMFDSDRHGANVKVQPIRNDAGEMTGWQVNIFDLGALLTQRPTHKARMEFGKAVGEALTNARANDQPFVPALRTTLLHYAQAAKDRGDKETANYLFEIPKAQLAQQDYVSVLSSEESSAHYAKMFGTFMSSGRMDPSIVAGIAMTGGGIVVGEAVNEVNKKKDKIGSHIQKILSRQQNDPRAEIAPAEIADAIMIQGGRARHTHYNR
ncbi:MAG: hypothetical protein EAY65_01620 [Alphaproteobacteria bacterium]|nr:MAG: hypothetical protein EAY65_01620 [Alphaproteobacteria bacterium]